MFQMAIKACQKKIEGKKIIENFIYCEIHVISSYEILN